MVPRQVKLDVIQPRPLRANLPHLADYSHGYSAALRDAGLGL